MKYMLKVHSLSWDKEGQRYQPSHALLSEGHNLFINTRLREYNFGKYLAE